MCWWVRKTPNLRNTRMVTLIKITKPHATTINYGNGVCRSLGALCGCFNVQKLYFILPIKILKSSDKPADQLRKSGIWLPSMFISLATFGLINKVIKMLRYALSLGTIHILRNHVLGVFRPPLPPLSSKVSICLDPP